MATVQNKDQKKKSHILKRRVYHDRYFAYAVAALVVAGIALVSYVVVIGNRFNTEASFSVPAQPNKIYINSEQGYSVSYPHTWVLELGDDDQQAGATLFENPANNQESISVQLLLGQNDEKKIRSELKVKSEKDFYLSDGSYVELLQVTVPDPATLNEVAFVTNAGNTFFISGKSSYFEAFVRNFKITQ